MYEDILQDCRLACGAAILSVSGCNIIGYRDSTTAYFLGFLVIFGIAMYCIHSNNAAEDTPPPPPPPPAPPKKPSKKGWTSADDIAN